ncbi:hypothetical protein HBI56_147290 [Parastagonospora nodorum]|nr:hypothetical protein HBH52_072050 [Parastagonospora nodorum]KAH5117904.1 hypothetical protein HBH71_103620 [Parastagonospora nodorum]KAH5452193.1 hypothetical protein HBI30_121950 [Parastagonospora nodorum]KAH6507670.1 hypothetical protein HBI56_147290 [Parastagonospora nodorum]
MAEITFGQISGTFKHSDPIKTSPLQHRRTTRKDLTGQKFDKGPETHTAKSVTSKFTKGLVKVDETSEGPKALSIGDLTPWDIQSARSNSSDDDITLRDTASANYNVFRPRVHHHQADSAAYESSSDDLTLLDSQSERSRPSSDYSRLQESHADFELPSSSRNSYKDGSRARRILAIEEESSTADLGVHDARNAVDPKQCRGKGDVVTRS